MILKIVRNLLGSRFDRYEANLYSDLFSCNRLAPSTLCSPRGNAARDLLGVMLNFTLKESPALFATTRAQSLQEIFAFALLGGNIRTYFEAGANDGVSLSNTFGLMTTLSARGILVEANPFLLNVLSKNRPHDHVVNAALSFISDTYLSFSPAPPNTLYGKVLSTSEKNTNCSSSDSVNVKASTILDVLLSASMNNIDFLSLDIEGGEYDALRPVSYPFFTCGFIEVNTRSAIAPCRDKLCGLGYECFSYPFAQNELLAIRADLSCNNEMLNLLRTSFLI